MNSQTKNTTRTRKLVSLAILSALAFLVYAIGGRIPISSVGFLTYDPKDVVIVIAGLIYGPLSAFGVSLVVSLIEMFTFSATGPIGMIMNVLSSCSFACTAAIIYKKRQDLKGAVIGLVAGVAAMVAMMLLWNYFITPMYMGMPREAVAAMLVPVFLPFNLIKGGLNAGLTMLLYKPVVGALRRTGLAPPTSTMEASAKPRAGVFIASLIVLAVCVLVVLFIRGII